MLSEVYLDHWKLPRELELMLKLCLRQPTEIPEGLDWDYFDRLVSQHRLQPLLIRASATTAASCPGR